MKSSKPSSLNCGLMEDEAWVAKKKRVGNQDVKVLGKCYNSETYGKVRYIRQVKARGVWK